MQIDTYTILTSNSCGSFDWQLLRISSLIFELHTRPLNLPLLHLYAYYHTSGMCIGGLLTPAPFTHNSEATLSYTANKRSIVDAEDQNDRPCDEKVISKGHTRINGRKKYDYYIHSSESYSGE